jgi:hypothetical protein
MVAQRTTSSEALILSLEKRGYALKEEDKDLIRLKILEVMKDAYDSGVSETESQQTHDIDCGCGQVNCPICGG